MFTWTVKEAMILGLEYLQHQELAYIKYQLQLCQMLENM
jgi:hypothetical protein